MTSPMPPTPSTRPASSDSAFEMIVTAYKHLARSAYEGGYTDCKSATTFLISKNSNLATDKIFLQVFPAVYGIATCELQIANKK